MDWRHGPPAVTRTPSCSSRSATPARRCCRSRRPRQVCRRCAVIEPCLRGRWSPVRTPASGAASARTSAARSSAATPAHARPHGRSGAASPLQTAWLDGSVSRVSSRGSGVPVDRCSGKPVRRPRSRRPPGGPSSHGPAQLPATRVRTICRPSRSPSSGSKPSGSPTPSSSTTTTSSPSRRSRSRTTACPSPPAQAVLDRVLQQLGQHHRQRRRELGVAASRTPRPRADDRRLRAGRHLRHHRSTPVGDLVERRRRSSGVVDSVSCTSAIDPTRRTASASAASASGASSRRACSRSSAATVCRLFFTRWWISRIVASLVMSSRSRRRSSLTSRSSTSAPSRARVEERDRAQGDHGALGLDLGAPGRTASQDRGRVCVHRAAPRAQEAGGLGQLRADQVGGQPEPAVGRQGVGAGVGDRPSTSRAAGRHRRAGTPPARATRPATGTCPRRSSPPAGPRSRRRSPRAGCASGPTDGSVCWAMTAITRPPRRHRDPSPRPDRVSANHRDDPTLPAAPRRPPDAARAGGTKPMRSSVKTVGPVVGRSWAAAT